MLQCAWESCGQGGLAKASRAVAAFLQHVNLLSRAFCLAGSSSRMSADAPVISIQMRTSSWLLHASSKLMTSSNLATCVAAAVSELPAVSLSCAAGAASLHLRSQHAPCAPRNGGCNANDSSRLPRKAGCRCFWATLRHCRLAERCMATATVSAACTRLNSAVIFIPMINPFQSGLDSFFSLAAPTTLPASLKSTRL